MNTDTVAAHARNAHSLGTQRTRPIEELDGVVDGAHDAISDKATRADMRILLEHGKPLRYGNDNTSGIRMRGFEPEAVTLDEQGVTEADLVVHDETSANGGLAFVLSKFAAPLPVPLGVFRAGRVSSLRNPQQLARCRHPKAERPGNAGATVQWRRHLDHRLDAPASCPFQDS